MASNLMGKLADIRWHAGVIVGNYLAQQVPNPTPDPNAPFMPQVNKGLGWLMILGLAVAVGSVIAGAIGYASGRASRNPQQQTTAIKAASGGVAAGALIGAASAIVRISLGFGQGL